MKARLFDRVVKFCFSGTVYNFPCFLTPRLAYCWICVAVEIDISCRRAAASQRQWQTKPFVRVEQYRIAMPDRCCRQTDLPCSVAESLR